MEKYEVFYSWQSDLPNGTNRSFIEKALEDAAKAIRADDSIMIEPVIDRDTVGVPGAPDIANTIFAKVEQSQVFACDVSIINQGEKSRKTPNPNVLIELGYALKTLTSNRILMIMNTAFGPPEELPFDLSKKRAVTYDMPQECKDRATERKALTSKLEEALRTIFSQIEVKETEQSRKTLSIADQARAAVENAQPNQVLLVRKFMDWLSDQLHAFRPDFSRAGERDDLLIESIDQTAELVIDFARLAQSVAIMNASESAIALYKSFGRILSNYYVPYGFAGTIPKDDFDFYKFIGHEIFVTFISFLMRENCWELIADILEEQIYLDNRRWDAPGPVSFGYISEPVGLLYYRKERLKLKRVSVHADILKARHTEAEIAGVIPMQQFMDSDYFLFLRGEFEKADVGGRPTWNPWSTMFLEGHCPSYIAEATRAKYAQRLLRPLAIDTIEMFRSKLVELKAAQRLARVFGDSFYFDLDDPLEHFNPQDIGTR
jgi:hypothetical protein